jgi:hypothetical protein
MKHMHVTTVIHCFIVVVCCCFHCFKSGVAEMLLKDPTMHKIAVLFATHNEASVSLHCFCKFVRDLLF